MKRIKHRFGQLAVAGSVACMSMLAGVPAHAQAATPTAPAACSGEAFRAFDFWVGRWDVYRGDNNQLVAHSEIDNLHDGCVIRERWMPLNGGGGSSLSHYDQTRRTWRQLWLDSSGGRAEFEGGFVDGRMVITGLWPNVNGPNQDAMIRMSYSRADDGSVVQRGDASTDQGLTWSLSFLFIYRPAATTETP